ncbi:MAG TPA: glycosyltransferase [Candidatus Angelobacter sp.]|nr:glycosyltransferase [Candidatus Angelobacter sp.]
MPAVSIIMNVRNGAATVREALQSALQQTVSGWELIVWDDQSTDDSARIVAQFSDNRIRYFLAQRDMSLGQAREAAISHAQGEWLAFLDQDDIWSPRKLELQLALAGPTDVGLVYGRTLAFYPNGRQHDHDTFYEFCPLPEGNILAELLGRGCFIAMSSAMLRRSAVLAAGVIPDHIRITPDYFLYLSVCGHYAARAVQEVVCRYRVHPGSMTSVYRYDALKETLQLVEQWRGSLPPETFARRTRQIQTAIAFEELRRAATFSEGLRRLLAVGSLFWMLGRPFVRAGRGLRRLVEQPYWKKSDAE